MPTYRITSPDGRTFDVSGNGTREEALAHVQSQYQPKPKVTREQLMAENPAEYDPASPAHKERYGNNMGAVRTAVDVIGAAPETALTFATGAAATPIAGLAGMAAAPFTDRPGDVVERVQSALTYQPQTEAGQRLTGQAMYPLEKLAQAGEAVGDETARQRGPVAGAMANTVIQSLPAVLLRGRVGNGRVSPNRARPAPEEAPARSVSATQAERPARLGGAPEKAPSLEQLKSDKDAAYKKAEQTGVVISRNALNRLKVQMVNDLKKEGLDKDLHPGANAALKRVLESKGQLSLSEIETLRKIANDAKGSINKADGRLGAKIVDHIDDFEAELVDADVIAGDAAAATAFKEARSLNTRYSKAREIGSLFERAELNAPKFSGSGMENALRTEFRALARNERKMRRFTPEEQAAIRRVAKGGGIENSLLQIGKLAPTGGLSLYMGLGAAAFGGPAGLAVPVIGGASRYAATKMTMRNARHAEEMMRRGSFPQQKRAIKPLQVEVD